MATIAQTIRADRSFKSEQNPKAETPLPSSIAMTGGSIVVKALMDQKVDTIFGYPGGTILPIYDALCAQEQISHLLVRHEQAAVHAAEGYARTTGKVGVVMVTSGPGATNTITGLADAYKDCTPLVCITGQVPTSLIGTNAFQEADIVNITRPCTKRAYLVRDVNELAATIHEAFHVARSGRPGPVVIDLPKDVQQAIGNYEPPTFLTTPRFPQSIPCRSAIEHAVEILTKAEKPLVFIGGGVVASGTKTCEILRRFIQETGFPCAATLMGLGAVSSDDNSFLGMVGMHGTFEANMAMHDCDAMLAIGVRFDDRVTGKIGGFAPKAKIIHIDITPKAIESGVKIDLSIVADASNAIEALSRVWGERKDDRPSLESWREQIKAWRARQCLAYRPVPDKIKPQQAISRLAQMAQGRDAYFTTEVGQHQMWAAQYLRFEKPGHFITSGGLGTMGFGFPAAIGVQMAHPDALVIDVAGDASIMMNIQELSTAVQYGLPVKIFILRNRWMGMVRQWQELQHDKRYYQTRPESLPDFVKLAEAFGASGFRAEKPEELDRAIAAMLEVKDRPAILEVAVDGDENCLPMILPGKAHNEMLMPDPVS
jgi:acetolactate synthase-1/2/3 large subunit